MIVTAEEFEDVVDQEANAPFLARWLLFLRGQCEAKLQGRAEKEKEIENPTEYFSHEWTTNLRPLPSWEKKSSFFLLSTVFCLFLVINSLSKLENEFGNPLYLVIPESC